MCVVKSTEAYILMRGAACDESRTEFMEVFSTVGMAGAGCLSWFATARVFCLYSCSLGIRERAVRNSVGFPLILLPAVSRICFFAPIRMTECKKSLRHKKRCIIVVVYIYIYNSILYIYHL